MDGVQEDGPRKLNEVLEQTGFKFMAKVRSVCGVATQGITRYSEWTTSYVLRMSKDGITWNPYEENNTEKVR